MESADVVAESSEEGGPSSNVEERSSSVNCEIMEEYDEERMKQIVMRFYNVDFEKRLNFPATFEARPSHFEGNRIWTGPMDYNEVGDRLSGQKANDGIDKLPAEILQYYSEIVEFASNKFADIQQQLDDNEHHIGVLLKAKANQKLPHFLQMNAPEVRLFPEESIKNLQRKFREILDVASRDMLQCTLSERYLLRAKLFREAEKRVEEVETEALTKWMEAQDDGWNGWDNIYKVMIRVRRDGENVTAPIPLSATVFRFAMKDCRGKISKLLEDRRLTKATARKRRKEEEKQRQTALASASALPRQEAEKSIEQRIIDLIEPLAAKVNKLQQRVEGNTTAPGTADASGAATKSANLHHAAEMDRNSVDDEQEAASDSQRRKKKQRNRSSKGRIDSSAPPEPARQDRANEAGHNGGKWKRGKWKRRRKNGRHQE
jgi:hypothetical protein